MKTTRLYVRLKPEEKARIKELAGNNISAFILNKVFKDVDVVEKQFKSTGIFTKLDNGTLIARDVSEPVQSHRCMKSHCHSMDAKLVVIQGMKAYLCKDHISENPF